MWRLLLIEGSHTEFLMGKSLVFATGWSITVMSIISEGWLVQVTQLRHHCIHSSQESLILYTISQIMNIFAYLDYCYLPSMT